MNILLLHAGDDERDRVEELSAAIGRLGSNVAVENLASGDYDRILDAVARADTVIYWPAESGD
ncbi:MAG: hypothetical protein NTY41_01375 [Proteobacteria bacterium]|nr:hypothetical protein [Pseudomonadota bacterium]